MTMAEKILAEQGGKSVVRAGDYIWARIDGTALTLRAAKRLEEYGIKKVFDPTESARLFKVLGISVIGVDSKACLFFRNAINIGLPVLICPGCYAAFVEGDRGRINMNNGEGKNLTSGLVL